MRGASADRLPSVEIEGDEPISIGVGHELLRRFLSALSWVTRTGVREETSLSGGRRVLFGAGGLVRHVRGGTAPIYLPEPNDSDHRALRSLALFREALSIESTPYAFLGHFKILNIVQSDWGKKGKSLPWLRAALGSISDIEARARIAQLTDDGVDVAEYLYVQGRCAIAHAFAEPVVDPDSYGDEWRLKNDMRLMRSLSEHVIECELGVKSLRTFYSERNRSRPL